MNNEQILFAPTPKQLEYIRAAMSGEFKYLLFGGAIRGGKSFCVFGTLLMLCKKYPGSRWAIVRDSLTTIKRTVVPSLFKICPKKFLKSYNQDTQTVTLSNGSEILLFAENYEDDKELNRWRGLEVNGFVLEEANELQEVSFNKAIERAGTFIPATGDKPKPIIMLTCNPAHGWVKTLFYDRYMNNTLPSGWMYLPSKITDNPFIYTDLDYMESLKNMPTYEYEVYVNGNWDLQVKTGGEFYKGFDLDKHTGDYNYDPMEKLFISFDENVNPYLPAGIFQVKPLTDKSGKPTVTEVRMIAEVLGMHPNNSVEGVCKMILDKFPPHKHKSTVELYGDSTSRKQDVKLEKGYDFFRLIEGYLRDYKLSVCVPKSNESVSMRGSWINAVLEKEVGQLRFKIDRRCKATITDFVMTKENPDGSKYKAMITDPKTKVRSQSVGHLSDLTDYFLCGRFSNEYQKYKSGGYRKSITTGKNSLSHNHY